MQSRQRHRLSVVFGPDNSRPNGITTTGERPPRPHSRHSPYLHSIISSHPFHPGGVQDHCSATYLPIRSHYSTPHGPPSLVSLPQFLSPPPPPRRSANLERTTLETPLKQLCQPPALLRKMAYPQRRRKTPDPCGYVKKDYCDLLPDVVRTLITERDQSHTGAPINPAIKLLERNIQRRIHQEAQDQWRSFLESSDHATNPKRYWSLLRKLGDNRSSPSPNISIAFEEKIHSSSKAIAQAFNKQFTGCSAQHDRSTREASQWS